MANNYFEICTSDKFKNKTGKLISDQGDILKVASQQMKAMSILKELFMKCT